MNQTIAMRLLPDQVVALRALREYLDRIDFVSFYRFAVTPARYGEDPHVVSSVHSWRRLADLEDHLEGTLEGRRLAIALMLPERMAAHGLTDGERRLAEQLVDAGILDTAVGDPQMGDYQLISAQEIPLLIDACVNHPDRGPFRVYMGRDSLRLAAWAGASRSARGTCLDLGTGCGLAGLSLSRLGASVTLTDVSEEALRLAAMNAVLAGFEDRVTLLQEDSERTLARSERHARVSFNPPYMAIPGELAAPTYAQGAGDDGLGFCRHFVERLAHVLEPHGVGFLAAELPGDDRGPFFAAELHDRISSLGVAVELFVDASRRLAADDAYFRALGAFLYRFNPDRDAMACQRLVEHRYLDVLGACRTYSTILRLGPAGRGTVSMRVLRRDQGAFPPS